MRATLNNFSKSKITVTLSPDLILQLDAVLRRTKAKSRSRLVEEALDEWLRNRALVEVERETEKYYRSLSKAEQKENQRWGRIAARSAKHLWDS